MNWYQNPAKNIDKRFIEKAQAYQNTLTKPQGALGELETLAEQFSAWQNTLKPCADQIEIVIMAGDHGVAEEGVSAFPQAVTGEMIKNFATGGAAISVLARHLSARLTVINLGSVNALPTIAGVVDKRIAAGTKNICQHAAMTQEQLLQALQYGKEAAEQAFAHKANILIGGEMGIANTTPAACIVARLLHTCASDVVGPGTGLDKQQIAHKIRVVERALAQHPSDDALEILRCLGGFEIAGLVGAFIAAAQLGIVILLDGYIVTAAALIACQINPSTAQWMLASHCSAEPAHQMMLNALNKKPLLHLSMRLGEGSGAAMAVPIIQMACRLQSEMASFTEAGVSNQSC